MVYIVMAEGLLSGLVAGFGQSLSTFPEELSAAAAAKKKADIDARELALDERTQRFDTAERLLGIIEAASSNSEFGLLVYRIQKEAIAKSLGYEVGGQIDMDIEKFVKLGDNDALAALTENIVAQLGDAPIPATSADLADPERFTAANAQAMLNRTIVDNQQRATDELEKAGVTKTSPEGLEIRRNMLTRIIDQGRQFGESVRLQVNAVVAQRDALVTRLQPKVTFETNVPVLMADGSPGVQPHFVTISSTGEHSVKPMKGSVAVPKKALVELPPGAKDLQQPFLTNIQFVIDGGNAADQAIAVWSLLETNLIADESFRTGPFGPTRLFLSQLASLAGVSAPKWLLGGDAVTGDLINASAQFIRGALSKFYSDNTNRTEFASVIGAAPDLIKTVVGNLVLTRMGKAAAENAQARKRLVNEMVPHDVASYKEWIKADQALRDTFEKTFGEGELRALIKQARDQAILEAKKPVSPGGELGAGGVTLEEFEATKQKLGELDAPRVVPVTEHAP
jgi:hypothetical protein